MSRGESRTAGRSAGGLAAGAAATAFTEDLHLIPDAEAFAVVSRSDASARRLGDSFNLPRT